jgi:4-aminobutyrate aminotransferase
MLVIGKGLGGGALPLAALLAREDLDIAGDRALGHFTHEKNPVLCAAALATLSVIETEKLPQRATVLGEKFREGLRQLKARHPLIADVRGLGLLNALILQRADGSPANGEAEEIMYAALSQGLSFKTAMGNALVLTPPLTIEEENLDTCLQILDRCFTSLRKN